MLQTILQWLEGKKTIIVGLSAAIISYLVTAGVIDASLGSLLQTIITILSGGAVIAGTKMGIGKK